MYIGLLILLLCQKKQLLNNPRLLLMLLSREINCQTLPRYVFRGWGHRDLPPPTSIDFVQDELIFSKVVIVYCVVKAIPGPNVTARTG